MKQGKVWLTGAGPGSSGLLTRRGEEVIEKADLIVYDALVGEEILSMLPEKTEKISVGKRAGKHSASQETINELLVKEAKQGKWVVRLKGGDPFVFGRGGEEVLCLQEAGIPFEMIPGVTSAIAVPAYAGIPVTHREDTSSVHIITGHPQKDGADRTDYEALVRLNGTLVFLMGISNLEKILRHLQEAGMAESMPAAVIEQGTTARQRKIVATVGSLAERAKEAEIQAPGILVVGKVCARSEKMEWREKQRLFGKRILVTRERKKAKDLMAMLQEEGAEVWNLPTIETIPLEIERETFETLEGKDASCPGQEKWFVFTSPVGVECFQRLCRNYKKDMRDFQSDQSRLKIAAIGSGTEARLMEMGWVADLVPEEYNGKELGRALGKESAEDAKIFLIRAKQGSEDLTEALYKAKRNWAEFPVYETALKKRESDTERICQLLEQEKVDLYTFTSSSTVRGMAEMVGVSCLKGKEAVCIGAATAATAREYGMKVWVAENATIESLVKAVLEWAKSGGN